MARAPAASPVAPLQVPSGVISVAVTPWPLADVFSTCRSSAASASGTGANFEAANRAVGNVPAVTVTSAEAVETGGVAGRMVEPDEAGSDAHDASAPMITTWHNAHAALVRVRRPRRRARGRVIGPARGRWRGKPRVRP